MVNGLKYQGRVDVYYNEGTDLFDVHLHNGVVEEDVYLDCLVNVIDGVVERTDDYHEKVSTPLPSWKVSHNHP